MTHSSRHRLRRSPVSARAGTGRFWPAVIALLAASHVTALALQPSFPSSTSPSTPPRIAYADGAPPGFTGGFKEESCHACHFEGEPNTPPGRLQVEGVPERFEPGQRYTLTVTLSRPMLTLGGFQLAARFEDGAQAGTLERAAGEENRTAVETQGTVQYVNQRKAGAAPTAAETARWSVVWIAPQTSRPVTINVAANAADGDEAARGDYVYTAVARSVPR